MVVTPRYLEQTVDYLGFLATALGDLQGFPTVVNELLQNSDDAPGVRMVSFDVRDDALVVRNNAPFRPEDFLRLQTIASGAKRDEADTTGAFGIGLIAVYQITDEIELWSAGKHWIVRPDQPQDKRIAEYSFAETDFTEFRFPWALDADSELRRRLRVQAVAPTALSEFLSLIEERLPLAALFLKKIETLEVKRHGELRHRVQRACDEDEVLIDVDGSTQAWRLVHGSFDEDAGSIRMEFPGHIEDKRRSKITIAIPGVSAFRGLLYATLPTQHAMGLPFHINADFYPTADRKRVVFEEDYKSAWNRAAIRAAAKTVMSNVETLRDHLCSQGTWELISDIKAVYDKVQARAEDSCFASFWDVLRPALRQHALVYTTRHTWCLPDEPVLLGSRDDARHIPLLEALQVSVVDEDLRPHFNLLTSTDVGVAVLTSGQLAAALQVAGLDREVRLGEAPSPLRNVTGVRKLWELIDSVVGRDQAQRLSGAAERFDGCAVALSQKRRLVFPSSVFRADSQTVKIFERLLPGIEFLDDLDMPGSVVPGLVPEFTAEAAVEALDDLAPGALLESWKKGGWQPKTLYRWFEARKDQILHDPDLRDRFRSLPIFPAGGELQALSSQVSLPGPFEDPLHLASLIDVAQLGGRKEFLIELGVHELSLKVYAKELVPAALLRGDVSDRVRGAVVKLLAENIGSLRDDKDAHGTLARCELVECEDGVFRRAPEAYFHSRETAEVLGDSVHYARRSFHRKPSIRHLFHWLGVSETPRPRDVCQHVERLVDKPPIPATIQAVTRVFRYLGTNWEKFQESEREAYAALRSRKWLPASGGAPGWYAPHELYAVYQDYLFGTQAQFLALPRPDQNAARKFIEFLGVPLTPAPALVVRHLQACAKSGERVNEQVYRFLNDHVHDPSIARLIDTECILLPDGRYVRPDQVFWGPHPFGRYRHQLGQNLHGYHPLFDAIGVRELPTPEDAMSVLVEIEGEFGENNAPLDNEARQVVLECWRQLTSALESEDIESELLKDLAGKKVVANAQDLLLPPSWMFLEDRPGLADRFQAHLGNNVVERIQGVWPAMVAAGVRRLSEAAVPKLLECTHHVEDSAARAALLERLPLLQRVLEAHRTPPSEPDVSHLADTVFFQAEELVIRFVLDFFGQEVPAEPEDAVAFFNVAEHTVYYVPREGSPPWPAIARELAYSLGVDRHAGPIATGINLVLAAPNATAAALALDELGYAPLEQPVVVDLKPIVVDDLGTSTGAEEKEPVPAGSSDGDGKPGADISTEEALRNLLGKDAPGPTPPPEDSIDKGEPVGTGTGGSGHGANGGARTHRGRLRSYVSRDGEKAGDGQSEEQVEARNEVDQAGIRRVEEYERSHGRTPTVMPQTHPGYDIESRGADGEIERYIEVKSIGGAWDSIGAGVTRAQFDKARDLQNKAWLYVVEKATDDHEFRIYTIQNPALKVDQFMYDDGWKAAAEAVWPPAATEAMEE